MPCPVHPALTKLSWQVWGVASMRCSTKAHAYLHVGQRTTASLEGVQLLSTPLQPDLQTI